MPEIVPALLALGFLLLCVSLLTPLADRLALPLPLLLAAFGIALGVLESASQALLAASDLQALGLAGDVLNGLATLGLGSDAFLYLFLPPLLFTAGLHIDVRLLIDEAAAVLLLAVVAVAVSTAVVGVALDLVSSQGLVVSLLLGAVVATTDPGAVVALFRDLGAPRRLLTLIAGESLLNDAAAIALFTILLSMLQGEAEPDLGGGLATFATAFVGGLALGFLLARLAVALLGYLHESPVAAITLSLVLAYMSFLLGDVHLSVSGEVAVVSAALTFAVLGPARLPPATWSVLTKTWEQVEFWASSLVFVLAAMLAVGALPQVGWRELGQLLVMIAAALAARALVLYGLMPGLSAARLVQPVAQRHKLVILWGGLRGALTLVLALAVSRAPGLDAAARDFVVILATGYVLVTLFVGAPTLKPLFRLLGLDRLSPVEQALRDRVMALSREAIDEQVQETARRYGFDPGLGEGLLARPPAESAQGLLPADSRRVGLLALATRERQLYLEHFDQRGLPRSLVGNLLAGADRLIDAVKTEGEAGYRREGGRRLRLSPRLRLALALQRRLGWTRPLAVALADRFELLLVTQLVLRELLAYNRRALAPVVGREIGEQLSALLRQRLGAVEDALDAVELQYPGYAEALRRQYLGRAALRLEAAAYQRHFAESLIGREVLGDLQRGLAQRRADFEERPTLDLGLRLTEMIRRVPIFAELAPERVVALARLLRARLAYPGERVVSAGERGDSMYFIASGEVAVALPDRTVLLGPGDFFGELALLRRAPRSADVSARGFCHLLVLEARDFRRLLRRDAGFRQTIERVAAARRGEGAAVTTAAD